jgi:L-alanine-DL-glutamate epimerase-like enolase superfamily enzyme
MGARVVSLEAWPVDVPMTKPFGIAGGAQEVARNAFVRATLEDGTVGYGEAAPFPAFNGETREGALAALAQAREAIVGLEAPPARVWRDENLARTEPVALKAAREAAGSSGAALCAIETALCDAAHRREGRRLFGAPAGELRTDVTIPIGDLEACADDAAAWAARGFTRFKVKVGGAGLDDALARAMAVHRGAPSGELMLDGNAGLSVKDATELLAALRARGVRPILFEQPCAADDVDGMIDVARASDVPVALDESASTLADLRRFTSRHGQAPAPLVVNVKPMKAGFREGLRVALWAQVACGMRLMIGGMVETRLSMSASACFVLGWRGMLDFSFVDLDTPLFLASDPVSGGYAQDGERLDLSPIAAGHGVVPRVSPGLTVDG